MAACGIDIDNITHVVNFDVPQDRKASSTVLAVLVAPAIPASTFITLREFRQLKLIERSVKTKIIRGQLPIDANVLENSGN